ncbi:MAG TPA: sigma 54-interacting transcriptional regulator [Thauera aminoaromatica]|nr:sigma 54-interacting transcriptional regulator [Thauera aminoaromatica]
MIRCQEFRGLAPAQECNMPESNTAKLLTLPNAGQGALSIRAKALIFHDAKSLRLLRQVELIAPTEANVLIIGETGTGKELVARHIHAQSGRSGPFVAVNCGAFSDNLVEAELFGHEAGAFTGAQQARAGWFEAANGGTLFLDEVGDLPLAMQVKLLRVLQERQVVRLGSRKPIPVDVRLVAATNVNLEKAVQAGHFRLDLYYRLNVAPVELPPLRERPGDILPLVEYFIDFYRQRLDIPTPRLSQEAAAELVAYHWPGNIRELENVVHFALIVCQNGVVNPGDLRLPGFALSPPGATPDPGGSHADGFATVRAGLRRLLDEDTPEVYERIEQLLFTTAFEYCRENQVRTAKQLGISRNILRTQLKRFGLIGDTAADALAAADA